jgi:predicted Ser/Thr protein kinase
VPTRPDDVTIGAADEARTAATSAATSGSASRPHTSTAFAPGAIIAGRYRLVALLGRGGMGEVYRADDLTLDQPVALKFLPAGVAGDDSRLAQFHNELRVARQVSHKNVVRLYDLGDADGRRFLTMEYVDGEDLGSLLRRIGRIPQDKALELARQLCAGVAAAHERGVLHRDLKPANVMIDGDGNVRITDFGIATAGADEGHTTSGTPQYMAPEQLAGKAASIRTDIYALGLVLFEIFTGRRAYDAKSLVDLKQLHDTGTITTPSSIVRDIEPAVERVILRCLARDPDQRPSSALTVAASLPGGDPLAEALAAGETPSPAMLVAAGESEALGVGRGLAAVALVVVGLAILIAVSPRTTVAGRSPLDKPPAVLIDRAQQILASVGYTEAIADSAYGFSTHQAFLRWIATTSSSPSRWDVLRAGQPSALLMWYRTSPRLLATTRASALVSPSDPPMAVSGMTSILLDSTGRMVEFQAVPPQVSAGDDGTPPEPAWKALFDAAGLDMSTFTPATPQWSPRDFADTRAAWEGPLTGHPDYKVRIEAAAYRGRPTSMLLLGPWSRPTRMAPLTRSTARSALSAVVSLLIISLTIAALLLARYNVRSGRADRRAAARLALFVTVGYAVMFLVTAHHLGDVEAETNLFTRSFGRVLIFAGLLWVMYLALEPYVRRFWPDGILGWTRLLAGYVRDPRVGKDLLTGCVIGMILGLIEKCVDLLPPLIGYPARQPTSSGIAALAGAAPTLDYVFDAATNGIAVSVFLVLGYVLLRLTLRRTSLAIIAAVILLSIVQLPQVLNDDTAWWISALYQMTIVVAATTIVIRYGLLVTTVALTLVNTVANLPLTYSLSHWTATTSNLTIALALGLALFGFYASRAGQPLFGKIGDMANG